MSKNLSWEVRDLNKFNQDELKVRFICPFLSISMSVHFSLLQLQQLSYEHNFVPWNPYSTPKKQLNQKTAYKAKFSVF